MFYATAELAFYIDTITWNVGACLLDIPTEILIIKTKWKKKSNV